jgi:hypothetical protein
MSVSTVADFERAARTASAPTVEAIREVLEGHGVELIGMALLRKTRCRRRPRFARAR